MGIKNQRFLLFVLLCSATGVIVGGTASWAESNQCIQANVVTNQCLTQSPTVKTIEGMATGLVAGAGAAVGAAWQHKRQG
ncbi:hypothetical protein ACKFKG_32650 [Phormidesmis sp. 146-35]